MRYAYESDGETLSDALTYDAITGIFTWNSRRSQSVKAGDFAGSVNVNGYVVIGFHGKNLYGHQVAWFLYHGVWADQIDHIDENKANNTISNLRVVTFSENMHNQTAARRHNSTGVRGVVAQGPSFRAMLTVNGVLHRLGTFGTIEAAKTAYDTARIELL